MAKADIWMPLYIGDYLADTMHLSTEEHGAYLLLLMALFKAGGSIDLDETSFAILTRLSTDRWAAMEKKMLRFFNVDGRILTHDRVTLEIEAAKEKSKKGTKGAAKRWGNASDMPEGMPSECLDLCPDTCPSDTQGYAQSIAPPPQSQSHSQTTTTNPKLVVVEIQEALVRCGVMSSGAAQAAIDAGGPESTLAALQWLENARVLGKLPYPPKVIYGRLTQLHRARLPVDQGWDDEQSADYRKAVEKFKQAGQKLRATVEAIPLTALAARHGPWADSLDLESEKKRLIAENQVWRLEGETAVRIELMRRKEMEVRNGTQAG